MAGAVTLYIVRHGETTWNQEHRFQGHMDVPLSDRGRAQVERLAGRLREVGRREGFQAVWSSDLIRASETARALAGAVEARLITHAGLREMDFGAWEGLTFPEIKKAFPDVAEAYHRDPVGTRMPGGEAFTDVMDRGRQVLAEIMGGRARRVIVVAHGGIIKAMLCELLGLDPGLRGRLIIRNTAVSIVRCRSGGGDLLLFNDTCHLEGN